MAGSTRDNEAGMGPLMLKPFAWARLNLFGSVADSALSLVAAYVMFGLIAVAFQWVILDATWSGESRTDCVSDGACWVFIKVRLNQFLYGFYPTHEYWRVNLAALLVTITGGWLLWPGSSHRAIAAIFAITGLPLMAYWLLHGGVFGLSVVESAKWGGVFLTVVVALSGIVLAIVFGVLLALGRRSELPAVRWLSTSYIELIRAVPLITILFMASVMLPLFLPEGVSLAKVLRAMIGMALFWAAYMAEAIRGGLQAVPRGQYEAAKSIGLSYWKSMGFVILPQALKAALPGIMNTIISLVKDTTLLLLIGIFELLGIVQAAAADPQWLGNYVEGYVFVAAIFFLFCFSMSLYSRRLERRLGSHHQI